MRDGAGCVNANQQGAKKPRKNSDNPELCVPQPELRGLNNSRRPSDVMRRLSYLLVLEAERGTNAFRLRLEAINSTDVMIQHNGSLQGENVKRSTR